MMKELHETESKRDITNTDEDKLYNPIEDLNRIEGGSVLKRNGDLRSFPKGIRLIGYFIIGFFVIASLLGIILSLFY